MAMRYIPFGYEISDAEIKVIEKEAEVIKNIFGLYVQGLSLQIISERLNLLPILYAEGRTWNKNIVKRILENPKYTGDKGYPVIIPPETARMALAVKEKKCSFVDDEDKIRTDAFRDRARCAVCGSRMAKLHCGGGVRKRTYWKCSNDDCIGNKHVLNEKDLSSAVADILNGISDNLEAIRVDIYRNFDKDESIVYAENELNEIMERKDAEASDVVEKMLELASIKFDRCMHGDYSAVTKEIEKCMAVYPHKDVPDGKTIENVIKAIKISPYKSVTVELKNGKEFTREKVSKWYRITEDSEWVQ